jgi:hypothetical protein
MKFQVDLTAKKMHKDTMKRYGSFFFAVVKDFFKKTVIVS